MKKIFLLMFFVNSCFAISGFTLNKRYVQGDTVTATNLTGNLDSGRVWSSRVADTMNNMVRMRASTSSIRQVLIDSSFQSLKVDTIRGPIKIDSVKIGGTGSFLTGYSVLTGTITADTTAINYPTGFTATNIRILSLVATEPPGDTSWTSSLSSVYIVLRSTRIVIKSSTYVGQSYQLIIAK